MFLNFSAVSYLKCYAQNVKPRKTIYGANLELTFMFKF